MRETCMNARRSRSFQGLRYLGQRASSIAHIVDYQTTPAFDVAHYIHYFGDVWLLATLIAQRQFGIQSFRVRAGPLCAARIGRNYGHVRKTISLVMTDQNRSRVQMVERNIKEPLDLRRVQ